MDPPIAARVNHEQRCDPLMQDLRVQGVHAMGWHYSHLVKGCQIKTKERIYI
jgi:hypothetical protein